MVLVFILLSLVILFLLFTFLILISTINVEIDKLKASNFESSNLEASNFDINANKINYNLIISLSIGKYLKWFKLKLDDEKIRKASSKVKFDKAKFSKIKDDLNIKDLKPLKNLKPQISKLNLDLMIGTENAVLTSFLVPAISTIISLLLSYFSEDVKKNNINKRILKKSDSNLNKNKILRTLKLKDNISKNDKYKYVIQPIYQNKNLYKIYLNCIIQVKMVHIINVIYIFLKKGRSDSNERTTSNRRSYGYSYE